jgi:hypothetical protein
MAVPQVATQGEHAAVLPAEGQSAAQSCAASRTIPATRQPNCKMHPNRLPAFNEKKEKDIRASVYYQNLPGEFRTIARRSTPGRVFHIGADEGKVTLSIISKVSADVARL